MKETLRHSEAFELYYSLGEKRMLSEVARSVGVSFSTIARWSGAFKWRARVLERDAKNAESIAKKTDCALVKQKTQYAQQIRDSLSLIRAALASAVDRIKKGSLVVQGARDLAALTRAQAELIRLGLLLEGEADALEQHKLVIELIEAGRGDSEDTDGQETIRLVEAGA